MATPGVDRRGHSQPSRALRAGPATGFYEIISAGLTTNSSSGHPVFYLGAEGRIVAAGWYCRDPGTNTTINFTKDTTPTTAIGGVSYLSATIDLDATPSGIARPTGTTPTLDDDRIMAAGEAQPWIAVDTTVTAGPITDLTVWFLVWRPVHLHSSPTMD